MPETIGVLQVPAEEVTMVGLVVLENVAPKGRVGIDVFDIVLVGIVVGNKVLLDVVVVVKAGVVEMLAMVVMTAVYEVVISAMLVSVLVVIPVAVVTLVATLVNLAADVVVPTIAFVVVAVVAGIVAVVEISKDVVLTDVLDVGVVLLLVVVIVVVADALVLRVDVLTVVVSLDADATIVSFVLGRAGALEFAVLTKMVVAMFAIMLVVVALGMRVIIEVVLSASFCSVDVLGIKVVADSVMLEGVTVKGFRVAVAICEILVMLLVTRVPDPILMGVSVVTVLPVDDDTVVGLVILADAPLVVGVTKLLVNVVAFRKSNIVDDVDDVLFGAFLVCFSVINVLETVMVVVLLVWVTEVV